MNAHRLKKNDRIALTGAGFVMCCAAVACLSGPAKAQAVPGPVDSVPAQAGQATPGAAIPANAPVMDPVIPSPGGAVTGQANAAGSQQWDANALGDLEKSLNDHKAVAAPATLPQELKTLFFTAWQYALLNEAKQLFKTRPPDASETSADPNAPKPTGPRELSLGGITFVNAENWTVWLNSKRIKPDAIPKEVLDIKVRKDHIDLKWYDTSTDLIYPVRLRPHQRFNLDTRIFLPGTGA